MDLRPAGATGFDATVAPSRATHLHRRGVPDARASFRRGAIDTSPVLAGIIPFGLVAGAAAADAGFGVSGGVGLSLIVFAGASQLAAIDLLARDAPLLVVVLTVAVINLRFAMYSAGIAPVLAPYPRRHRMAAATILTDQAFALTVSRAALDEDGFHALAYYAGVAVPLWVGWQMFTVVGAVVGTSLPDWLPLSATIPLVFLSLLVPAVTDRATAAAVVVSAILATVFTGLPYNAGLIVGASAGILAGTVVALQADPTGTRQP